MGALAAVKSYIKSWVTRSLENPATSFNDPENWIADQSPPAASGVRVSVESALRYSPWWRGINLVSRDVGKLPFVVYKNVGGGKERDKKHPAYSLMRYRVNNELMSAFIWKQTMQSHAMSYGNGYSWIKRSGDARPQELIILNPFDVIPFRENGRLWYAIRVNGEWIRENPANIFHIKGLSPDGLVGYPVYSKAREAIGEGSAAQKYGSVFFRNAARPSVVIEVPASMSDDAQITLLKQWERMHTGLESAHRTAILTQGAKVNPFSTNAQDAQLLELREFSLVDIANYIGVPVHKVGGKGRTAYASLEQENQAYLDESLDPWLVCWEAEAREKLLTEQEKRDDTHTIEFVRQALVRADMVTRYNAYNIAIRGGWMNRDGVLNLENMNPMPDGEGQKYFRPLELAVVGSEPEVNNLPVLTTITEAVVGGTLPPESAKAMLAVSFPLLTTQQINEIIDPLENWEAPEPPAPPAPVVADGEPSTPDQTAGIIRSMVVDASRRAVRAIRIQAMRRAKLNANFLNTMDDDRPDDKRKAEELLDAPVRLLQANAGGEGVSFACDFILDEVKAVASAAADKAHSRQELPGIVEQMLTELESTLPERVAELLMPKGLADGTPLPTE